MINLGLIGTGIQGKRIVNTMATLKDIAKITHVCNSHSNLTWEDLLDKKLDGIILAAHPSINQKVLHRANFLGVPVLCEKPVGLFLSDVERLKHYKTPILVNYIQLFNPGYIKLKNSLTSPVIQIAAINHNNGPIRDYNSLLDYGVHDLSMCFDLLDNDCFDIVKLTVSNADNGGLLYKIHLKTDSADVHILTGNGGKDKQRKIGVLCADSTSHTYDDTKSTDYTAPLENVVKHFIDVIKGAPVRIPIDLSIKIHKVLFQLGKKYNESKN